MYKHALSELLTGLVFLGLVAFVIATSMRTHEIIDWLSIILLIVGVLCMVYG